MTENSPLIINFSDDEIFGEQLGDILDLDENRAAQFVEIVLPPKRFVRHDYNQVAGHFQQICLEFENLQHLTLDWDVEMLTKKTGVNYQSLPWARVSVY